MSVDVAIVGLGTAGASVAAACADSGLSVVGIDRADLGETGARWCNGVPAWSFDEAGFDRPVGEELREPEGGPFNLVAGWGPTKVTTSSVMDVDMRFLTKRLLNRAREHGADLRGGVKVTGFDGVLQTEHGPIEAKVYVDAAGLTGPKLDDRPDTPREDLCVASQQVYEIADHDAAVGWFQAQGVKVGEVCCFTGVAGGYSILNVRMHGSEVGILTGSIPADGVDAGTVMLDKFVESHPWIGNHVFGGARAIPLGLPHPVIGAGNVARIGDSAGMVHAAHGSGIAQQMIAARLLAETLKSGGTPADYNVAWQRRYGGILGGADVFRRFSQTLSTDELSELIRRKVMNPTLMKDTMTQKPVKPPPVELAKAVVRLARVPRIARRMVPVIARMQAMEFHYRRYPSDPAKLGRWMRRRDRIAG